MTWWTKKNGRVDGPFDVCELKRRIGLGLFGRFDRVSNDKITWKFVKDTDLWQPTESRAAVLRAVPVALSGVSRGASMLSSIQSVDVQQTRPDEPPGTSQAPSRPVSGFSSSRLLVVCALVAGLSFGGFVCLAMLLFLRLSPDSGRADGRDSERQEQKPAAVAPARTNDVCFADIKYKVVVIGAEGTGGGSAFLLKERGRTWLVTNEHVTRGGGDLFKHVMLIDGRELQLGRFEVAVDRDIARFEVIGDCPALELAKQDPNVGDRLSIYGNSLGGGAITELKGTVRSLGPLRLEVDAEAVSGNSGSAVLNDRGEVTGIFTYVRNEKVDEKDKSKWGVKGTQFDAVRRFAVRFTNVRWRSLDWDAYQGMGRQAEDLVDYLCRLAPLLDADQKDFNPQRYRYRKLNYESDTGKLFRKYPGLEARLVALSAACLKFLDARDKFNALPDDGDHGDERSHWAQETLVAQKAFSEEKIRALQEAASLLDEAEWLPQISAEMVINVFGGTDDYRRVVEWNLDWERRTVRDLEKILSEEGRGK